jgi:SAM-dependent methyltransferase
MTKRYDRTYFDRWYRDPGTRMWSRAAVARKARMVLGIAEHLLERPVRSVLDVGCGEAGWRAPLRRARAGLRYRGVDGSPYVVERFGRTRGIVLGELGWLERTGITGTFDLVVCCDVLHYVPTADARRGLRWMAERTGGLAYLEAYGWDDDIVGDRRQFQRRSAAEYRRMFREAGFVPVGLHCHVTRRVAGELTELERVFAHPDLSPLTRSPTTPPRRGTGTRRT